MARRSIVQDDQETEINLSPMIDCIFILLIFFIVTTVFVEEQGFQADKPDAAAAATPDPSEAVTLEITAENKVLLNGKEIRVGEVASRVKDSLSEPDTPVTIRSHENSAHGTFVAVWDGARRGGAEALSFSTVN